MKLRRTMSDLALSAQPRIPTRHPSSRLRRPLVFGIAVAATVRPAARCCASARNDYAPAPTGSPLSLFARTDLPMTKTPCMADRLDSAGLPAVNLVSRRAALPDTIQQLHHRIPEAIATTGAAPTSAELTGWASELGIGLSPALRALADAELVFTNADATAVIAGVPFAANNASAHRVQITGGPTVAANCAVDALGIPVMLGRDAEIHSIDPHSGESVVATSREGTWQWQPESAVVFVGSNGPGPLTMSCCPVSNFFTCEDNDRAYQHLHHLDGDVLTMPEAAEAGALVFGDLLAGRETA